MALGVVLALWSASAGMAALQSGLNAVYNVKEGRPLWKVRSLATLLTVVCSLLVLTALAIVLYGKSGSQLCLLPPRAGTAHHLGLEDRAVAHAFLFIVFVFALIYYAAPDVQQRHWEWISPGAVIGIVLWLLVSFGFRAYLHFFNSYSATYGSLGAVIILMLWFYVTGVAILTGGEVNAEIENAADDQGEPQAKHKGQKRPKAA